MYQCPNCKKSNLTVSCFIPCTVSIDENGDVTSDDEEFGGYEWDNDSPVNCNDCKWSGSVGEATRDETEEAAI